MPPCESEDRTSRGVGGCVKGDVSPSPPSGTVLLDGPAFAQRRTLISTFHLKAVQSRLV